MKRYIFKEQEIINEYRYIFLCGSHYERKNERDKRNVLRDFLKGNNSMYRPIILEDNFIFRNNKSRNLAYDDIHMKDLYQVEMLTNYLSDNSIIIHESISTGAETGLLLSEAQTLKKTCLLVPDEYAVEESKLGQFIRLAFMREPNAVKVIKFYPSVEKNIFSNDVMYWHTYFYKNEIGLNLGNQILEFLENENVSFKIRFTNNKSRVDEGYIHYKYDKDNQHLEITALPRILLCCIAAIFNIDELSKKIFNAETKELKDYIEDIKNCLLTVFTNSIEEETGASIVSCSIHAQMNVNGVYIAQIIGMSLYLFQAAGFIQIVKAADYMESRKVEIHREMVTFPDGTQHYFYKKYHDCIRCAADIQVI